MSDFTIIGAGPAGLTTAWLLTKYGYRCTIIEASDSIGGCHRVQRVNNLFSEHGPRIYSNSYLNFQAILKDMDLDFYDLFTKYDFTISNIGSKSIFSLSHSELGSFFLAFVKLIFDPDYGKTIPMKKFMESKNFREKSKDYIDRLCRLTDGADSSKYTLYEFLQLANQQSFYTLYQPSKPNDVGLFKLIEDKLKSRGVDIILNTQISSLKLDNNKVTSIMVNSGSETRELNINNLILCVPPIFLYSILQQSNLGDAFGCNLACQKWVSKNSYIPYISVAFHWNTKLDLPKVWGFPSTKWGIVFIILSKYMKFEQPDSQTVISTAISILDVRNDAGKLPYECTEEELITEILKQLRVSFTNLPDPTKYVIYPVKESAFVFTDDNSFINFQADNIPNLYTVGTHNGKSLYHFTSYESAVTNSIAFIHSLIPSSKCDFPIQRLFTLINFLKILFFILILIISLIIFFKYNKKR
jgi:hypothetical protein